MMTDNGIIGYIKWLEVQSVLYWAEKLDESTIKHLEEIFDVTNQTINWKTYLHSEFNGKSEETIRKVCKDYCEEFGINEYSRELIIPENIEE
tara:strand:- start:2151 stop:2426 length:276 start_codon:yes stop_codon:yes gene_type:complete